MLFVDTLGNSSCPRPAALVGAAELHPLELPASLLQRESLFTARVRIAGPELLEDENPPKVPASPATVVEEERRVRPAAALVDKATSIGVVPPELLESQAVRRAYQKLPQHGQDTVPALQTTEVWEKDYVDDVNEPDAWAVIRNRPALPAGVRSELDRDYVQRDNEAQLADRSAPVGAGFADGDGEAAVQVLTQAADSGSSADAEKVVEKAAGGVKLLVLLSTAAGCPVAGGERRERSRAADAAGGEDHDSDRSSDRSSSSDGGADGGSYHRIRSSSSEGPPMNEAAKSINRKDKREQAHR